MRNPRSQSIRRSLSSVLFWIVVNDTKSLVWMKMFCFVFAEVKMETFENVWVRKNKCKYNCNLFTHEAPKSSRNSFKGVRAFQVELEFGKVGFYGGRKTEEWPEKNPRSKDENQHQTQPMHMTPSPGIEPGPHWWEAQVLSPLLPLILWMGPESNVVGMICLVDSLLRRGSFTKKTGAKHRIQSFQSLICLRSAPALLFISLFLFVSARARKRSLRRGEGGLVRVSFLRTMTPGRVTFSGGNSNKKKSKD